MVQDKGTRIFLDFGMQITKANQYFGDFINPRALNGMGDLFEFDLLPRLKGLYRQDYALHTGLEESREPAFDAVVLTHAHMDHAAYLHYIRPDIPVFCSEATKLVMQGLQETGNKEEYVVFKKNFQLKKDVRGRGEEFQQDRAIKVIEKPFKIDSIEVEPLAVDHSVPGVTGLIIRTSKASTAYTADLRFHGRRAKDTERFVQKCSESDIDIMLCEGTRVEENSSRTEKDVESDVKEIVSRTGGLVVCAYPARDLDRLLSFYLAAKDTDRDLVIDLKQAYMLKLFQTSDVWKKVFPRPDDKRLKIFIPRKSWGLVGRQDWPSRLVEQDYDRWEREFLDYKNAVNYQDVGRHQKDLILYCSDYQLQQLIDVRPMEGSGYIRSLTEPFNEEMEFKEERVKRWLVHFGLLASEEGWNHSHVSGHGSGDQIRKVIEESDVKRLVPIHTEHEEYHKKWHDNVKEVELKTSLEL